MNSLAWLSFTLWDLTTLISHPFLLCSWISIRIRSRHHSRLRISIGDLALISPPLQPLLFLPLPTHANVICLCLAPSVRSLVTVSASALLSNVPKWSIRHPKSRVGSSMSQIMSRLSLSHYSLLLWLRPKPLVPTQLLLQLLMSSRML